MCSPSETTCSNNNSPAGLINSNSSSTDLQNNQQDLSPNNASLVDLESSPLTVMPFPPVSRSRATPQETPLKACNKRDNSLDIAKQDRFTNTRLATSYEQKFIARRTGSPVSTSDIWADPDHYPPSSPLDYLRDIDLTPCTTLSSEPSRTPDEDLEDPWRHAKSLEIPDLEQPMRRGKSVSPTAIANEVSSLTNPYYRKVSSTHHNSHTRGVPSDRRRQSQHQAAEASANTAAGTSLKRPVTEKNRFQFSESSTGASTALQQKLTKSNQEYRDPQEYCERPQSHQLYAVPHPTMQGQYYYNQQQQLQQQHRRSSRVSQQHSLPHAHPLRSSYIREPRSPHSYKNPTQSRTRVPHSPRNQASSNSNKQTHHGQHQRPYQHGNVNMSPSPSNTATTGSGGVRPTYEILKTLLRKKACLYEPGTSKAIALITWLVGRKLALDQGYFSRQHLQSGVHAVVAEKIESGMITRTKVNRCMQIILNSCFHYIIPRPDGTEENGDLFKETFAENVEDDRYLLQSLPHPWNDLKITDEFLADKCSDEKDTSEKCEEKGASKRVVLLCFNENVRCAEDVLRCHNDFIRDAAITGKLNLSAEEWRQFFSLKDDDGSKLDPSNPVTESLVQRPKGGCDIPYLSFHIPSKEPNSLDLKLQAQEHWCKNVDSLGQMNGHELSKFRTTWCCKRYDHDHSLCRFAHVDINHGWLRRDPSLYKYSDQMCPHVTVITAADSSLKGCYLNTCPDGLNCKYAHSQEEINYHPKCYKTTLCNAAKPSCLDCKLRDICPMIHSEPHHPHSPTHSKILRNNYGKRVDLQTRKSGYHGNSKHSTQNASSSTTANPLPMAAPIIYHKPAPSSEFEKTILFPGLQSLYRRNCAMTYAHFLGEKEVLEKYSNFGEGWEEDADDLTKKNEASNKCFSLYSMLDGK